MVKSKYTVDLSLRNHILPRRNYDFGFTLENVVCFELLRRGYQVMIGKIGSTEVDFVAEKHGEYSYAMRWGIETSFRELKYSVTLLHLHCRISSGISTCSAIEISTSTFLIKFSIIFSAAADDKWQAAANSDRGERFVHLRQSHGTGQG